MVKYQSNNTTSKTEKATSIGWIRTSKTPEELGYVRGFRKVK